MTKTNLEVLNPSRKKRRVGDIFAFQVQEGEFGFGRLISTSASIGGVESVHLIYIYRATSLDKSQIPNLSSDTLLIPPLGINQKPWTLGYFETIENRPLKDEDVLSNHCFKDIRGWYFDENGNKLDSGIEPCGVFGLHSYLTLDDEISKALGIDLVPDD